MKTKEIAVLVSGILGFVATTYFAWTLYKYSIPQNIASWAMVLLLEVIGLVAVIKSGNSKPYLQVGWTMAAFAVLLAITLSSSPWQWGWTESVSLVGCVVAIFFYLTLGAHMTVFAYMAAMYISFAPLMVDYWDNPQPETLWFWCTNITACLCAVYGAPRRDFANTFIPWASIAQNATIGILCIL